MKHTFSILSVAALIAVAVVACGPSAEDKAKETKKWPIQLPCKIQLPWNLKLKKQWLLPTL